MNTKLKWLFHLSLFGSLMLGPLAVWAETDVNVVALFSNKAMVIINKGKPQILSVGQQSAEGVKLIAADTTKAVLEIEGKRKELRMGQAATIGSGVSGPTQVTLYANSAGHYFTEGQINGKNLDFVVDTGATLVALNSGDASFAGIDYKRGERAMMRTANGNVMAYRVVINSLKLGSVVLNQVEGVVMEGGSPDVVLLGMSALNRLDMKREGIALTLTKKF